MSNKTKLIILGATNIVCFISALIIALIWGEIIPGSVTLPIVILGGVLLLAAITTLVIFIVLLVKTLKANKGK